MKRLFTLLLLSFAALSCEMIDEKLDDLLDKRDWVVFAEGTELSVDVPSKQTVLNYKFESTLDWEVKTEAEWLEIDPMSGKAGKDIKIQIIVHKNKDEQSRIGYVDLVVENNDNYRITIKQAGTKDEENDDVVVDIPKNQIRYTSTNGEVVEPYNPAAFNIAIISNTYENGQGIIAFDSEVNTIGEKAFYNCSSLASVTIPNSVTTIGKGAFYGCTSLTSITIPDSVTTIGFTAFHNCSILASVTIPDSVTEIGHGAFCGCSNLQEFNGKFASEDGRCLIVDGTLISFAPAGLTEYTIPDSVTTIGNYTFYYCDSLISVTIPDSVTTIGFRAFSHCRSLTSVTIPDSVTTIGDEAFGDCSSLTSVTIPDSVTTIGRSAFSRCESLTSITIPDSVTTIGDYAFSSCHSLTSVTIPDSVTTIGSYAFASCTSLTSVTIPNSVTTIGNYAFSYCSSLTSVTIGDSVTTIGEYAFYYCRSLTSVTIGDSVTTIGRSAFSRCESLTSITIPDSVTTIGESAFQECYSLTSVYCKATIPPSLGSRAFQYYDNNVGGYCNLNCRIYVPTESVEAYKSASGWSEYADDIVGYNF